MADQDAWNGADLRLMIFALLALIMVTVLVVSSVRQAIRGEAPTASFRDRLKGSIIAVGLGLGVIGVGVVNLWAAGTDPMTEIDGPFARGAHGWSIGVFGGSLTLLGLFFLLSPLLAIVARRRARTRPRRLRKTSVPAGRGESE